jgi:hypothetical protein
MIDTLEEMPEDDEEEDEGEVKSLSDRGSK